MPQAREDIPTSDQERVGFPRPVGRAPSQKEVALLVGRKHERTEFGAEGELVMLAVNSHDQLVVEAVTPKVVGLLTEIRDQNKAILEALLALR